jgi:glycosyltransferase involved in cell wall biosynthesis
VIAPDIFTSSCVPRPDADFMSLCYVAVSGASTSEACLALPWSTDRGLSPTRTGCRRLRRFMNEKILHLRSSTGLYGAEQVILNLARELNSLGCINHVGCFNNTHNPHLELLENARAANVSALTVDCRGAVDRHAVESIRRIIEREDIDVIHCHDCKTRVFGWWAAKGLKVRKVATNHLWTHGTFRNRIYEGIDGLIYNGFDKVVAVSELIEHECRRFILDKHKLTYIPNGIDPTSFSVPNRDEAWRARRAQLGLHEDDLVIGNFARLSGEKDQATLLRAFGKLTERSGQKSHKLLFAGDGPAEHDLRQLAVDLSVHDKCLFLGVRKDIPHLLNCVDVYVQSSRREGLPMIILEAMAAKAAIVSTKAGAIPKVIVDGEHGAPCRDRRRRAARTSARRSAQQPRSTRETRTTGAPSRGSAVFSARDGQEIFAGVS